MTALTRPYWIEARFERREGWDDGVYPFNLPVLKALEILVFHPRVTFLVGENGAGKSTLIEALAIAWGFNAEGGSRDHRFSTRASHSPLHRFIRPVRAPVKAKDGYFLRAESFFTTASYVEASGTGRAGQTGLHEQSHGESFFNLFDNRFMGDGLYILDEPEAGAVADPAAVVSGADARAGAARVAVHHRHPFADHSRLPRRVALSGLGRWAGACRV